MNSDWRETLFTKALLMIELFRLDKVLFKFFNLAPVHSFTDYFRGFERNGVVRRLFGVRVEAVLRGLKVQFSWVGGYMGVAS
jgi:hypothetical protein